VDVKSENDVRPTHQGEHCECHMFVGTLNKKKSVKGYLDKGFLEVHNLRRRHDELAAEMVRRGMNHSSPLTTFEFKTLGRVNPHKSFVDLFNRCSDCRQRYLELCSDMFKLDYLLT